jgi:hypothetical protein
MSNGYPDWVEIPGKYMGDPGSVTSAVAEARLDWEYLIPIYNRVWRFTTQKRCLDSDSNNDICSLGRPGEDYDPDYFDPGPPVVGPIDQDDDYCEDDPDVPEPPEVYPPDRPGRCDEDCCCTSEAAGIFVDPADPYGPSDATVGVTHDNWCYEDDPLLINDYTTDNGLNGKYYYNVIGLECFHVDQVITSGPIKKIMGCLSAACVVPCEPGAPWEPGDDGPLTVILID